MSSFSLFRSSFNGHKQPSDSLFETFICVPKDFPKPKPLSFFTAHSKWVLIFHFFLLHLAYPLIMWNCHYQRSQTNWLHMRKFPSFPKHRVLQSKLRTKSPQIMLELIISQALIFVVWVKPAKELLNVGLLDRRVRFINWNRVTVIPSEGKGASNPLAPKTNRSMCPSSEPYRRGPIVCRRGLVDCGWGFPIPPQADLWPFILDHSFVEESTAQVSRGQGFTNSTTQVLTLMGLPLHLFL